MEFKPGSNNRLSHSSSWSVLTWKTRERQNSKTKKVAISDNTCNVTLIRNMDCKSACKCGAISVNLNMLKCISYVTFAICWQ